MLLAHLALALGVSVTMPLFEEYDEASHVLFVRYMQVHGALPVQTTDTETARAHHPPAYYALGALLTSWVPVEGTADKVALEPNPYFRIDPGERDPDNKLRWVHYGPAERWPYADIALLTHVLRALTAVFSTLGVLFTYLAARALKPGDEVFALFAAALLAFNPEVVFNAGLVYNDAPALAGAAAVLYLLCRFERSGWTWGRWAALGVALGVGMLLKLNVLVLAPAVAGVWAVEVFRSRSAAKAVVSALAFALPFGLLTGWWFWRNYQLYGDLTGNAVIVAMWGTPPVRGWWVYLQQLWDDPLGRFGTGEWVSFPSGAYTVAQIFIVLSLISSFALSVMWLRHAVRDRRALEERVGLLPILWGVIALTLAVGLLSVLGYAVQVVGFAQTRYLFPVYPALMLVLAVGILGWVHGHVKRWVALIGSGVLLLASAYMLFGLIMPVFGPPPTPNVNALPQAQRVDAQIGDVARILGYTVQTTTTPSEVELTVSVYWQPLRQTPQPYSVFVHLLAPISLAQRDSYPGQGNWSTTVWDVERPFVDVYRLRFDPAALPLTDAQIVLGLYDRNTLQRLPVSGVDVSVEERWVRLRVP